MLTLFTIPKPFQGHTAIIQRNAIRSWTLLHPHCEIIIFGDEEGSKEIALEFGLKHVPKVARNEFGTPLVNDIFEKAQQIATHNILCYVNADIILMSDFIYAVKRIRKRPFRNFIMIGRRWDVDIDRIWDFDNPNWETSLRKFTKKHGKLHQYHGIDYIVFTRNLWGNIPRFAIGRPAWDNWMIYQARAQGAAVIDATQAVMAIHQNHDFHHIPGGTKEARNKGPEARYNFNLAGGEDYMFGFLDATWILTHRWIIPALTRDHLNRRIIRFHVLRKPLAKNGINALLNGQLIKAAQIFLNLFSHLPLIAIKKTMGNYRSLKDKTLQAITKLAQVKQKSKTKIYRKSSLKT